MAARKRVGLSENTRKRIQTTMLVKRLMDHALGDDELMTQSQIRAAEILLKKTLPDTSSVTLQGDEEGGPMEMVIRWEK